MCWRLKIATTSKFWAHHCKWPLYTNLQWSSKTHIEGSCSLWMSAYKVWEIHCLVKLIIECRNCIRVYTSLLSTVMGSVITTGSCRFITSAAPLTITPSTGVPTTTLLFCKFSSNGKRAEFGYTVNARPVAVPKTKLLNTSPGKNTDICWACCGVRLSAKRSPSPKMNAPHKSISTSYNYMHACTCIYSAWSLSL